MMSLDTTQKPVSTELTGGAGFTFEDAVVAYYLAALLRREGAAGQPGTVTSVAVQQRQHGHPMDDLVVEFEHDDLRRRLSLQTKRKIVISAAASNTDFRDVLKGSAATRETLDFQPDIDAYGFAVEMVAQKRFRALNRLIDWAKSSPTGEDFARRFTEGGSAAAAERHLRAELLPLIAPKSPNDEADFYRQLSALKLDELMDGGIRRTEIVNRLQELVVSCEETQGILLFDCLCRIAREGAGTARIWTRPTLLGQLKGKVRLSVTPSYRADVDFLQSFSMEAMADVSEEIEGFRVERPVAERRVRDRLAECRLVSISGLPGCGKSAVLKRIAGEYAKTGPILFLKSDRLTGTSWLAFAGAIGIHLRDIAGLLAEIASTGTPILFIDGIDRIRPDQKGIVTEILRAIENNEHLSDWKVLASSRDQGLEAYRSWFPSTFYRDTGIGDVSIESFNDSEAYALAKAKPILGKLLLDSGPVGEIARRPFFAAVLARSLPDNVDAPQTEVDLIDAWWIRGGHDAPEDTVPERRRALLDLAEKGVRTLGKNIAAQDLKDATFAQIAALKSDYVIREHDGGAFYSFTHDIFFEWVFFRLLIERGPDWPLSLAEAGEPPLLGRVVGLLAQHAIASPKRWTQGYRDLETRALRPQWRREWLTAAPFTPAFVRGQKEFQTLLTENDYALFEKLLVWFQAQHTIPSPLILLQSKNLIEGVNLVRMADMLGWPSDFRGWRRLLDWIFPLAPSLPARLLPNVAELFGVWQNLFAGIQNPGSAQILHLCSEWLIELEESLYTAKSPGEYEKWGELGRRAQLNLVTKLRTIVLQSANIYPEPAVAIFERAITDDRIRRDAYGDLVGFTSTMANVAPNLVLALAKAELMEELPQERIARIRQEEHNRLQHLQRIRAIPEHDRTDGQRRALESAFFPLGHGGVDLHETGIDEYHQSYFPTSALHEPFQGLFAKKPAGALRLVRDLANHATKGWHQSHDFNREQMGTPIPIVVEFPWGKQIFWGDWHVYSWFLGELAPNPLACGFLALSHWAFKQIEEGRPTDEIIHAIVEGNECYAVLGLALVLALETFHVSETTLPIVTCQRLWRHDMARVAQEPTRDIDLFGSGFMRRLTGEKAKATEYLKMRASRSRNVRELAMRFALGPDMKLRDRIRSALADFPYNLPHEIEETRSDPKFSASLKEDAEQYAGLGDIANYRKQKIEDEQVVVSYESPIPATPERAQKLAASTTYLQETAIIGWAMKSLADNVPSDGFALTDAVALARARDNPSMFEVLRDVGDDTTQSMIASVAACVIRLDGVSSHDRDWALDVLLRIERMKERPGTFFGAKSLWHPVKFLLTGLELLHQSNPSDLELARRLMRLTAYPIEEIRNLAFAALFRDPDPRTTWVTAQLAVDLAISHRPKINKDGRRDDRGNRAACKRSLKRALKALATSVVVQPTPLPAAWVKTTRRAWHRPLEEEAEWDDPDPSFNAPYAASVFQHFSVELWCQNDTYKPLLGAALKRFVVWTSERLMPPWSGGKRDPGRNTAELVEWTRGLGDLLARAAPYFETEVVRRDFLGPFLTDDEGALSVLAPFADRTVCRHVLDSARIPSNTFDLLRDCVDRVIRDPVFSPQSYRAGEVNGSDMPELIRALLFVAVEKADGASRFVNGDWSDIDLIMPLVTRLVTATGWSDFVMDKFLTLCERAGNAYPLDAFATQANSVLASVENAKGTWNGTTLPARTAGVVQCLADANFPLRAGEAQALLRVLDALIDLGDRRSVALEQTEAFRGIQGSLTS